MNIASLDFVRWQSLRGNSVITTPGLLSKCGSKKNDLRRMRYGSQEFL